MAFKHVWIGAGLAAFRLSGLHKVLGAATRGRGVILTAHRVRPWREITPGYAPNRGLEITPEFLDEALGAVARLGFEIVSLSEAVLRLETGRGAPFAALTFDDGYRDTRDFALPILQRHRAPFTVFFAIGMIERTARLWWLELEEAVRRLDFIAIADWRLPARSPHEKSAAYDRLYGTLRARPESELLQVIGKLAARVGVSSATLGDESFLDWNEVAALAKEPLLDVGAHSLTHRRLAQWPLDIAREEMAASRTALERRLKRSVKHFAYPVGDPTSAGPREFALAQALGFACAVTTRPGLLYPEHARHLTALPRVSLNGLWQDVGYLEALLSGAPFALWNRGRRVNVA